MIYQLPQLRYFGRDDFLYVSVYRDEEHLVECERNHVLSILTNNAEHLFTVGAVFIIDIIGLMASDKWAAVLRNGKGEILMVTHQQHSNKNECLRVMVDLVENKDWHW